MAIFLKGIVFEEISQRNKMRVQFIAQLVDTNGPYRISTSNFFFENVVPLTFAEKMLSDR